LAAIAAGVISAHGASIVGPLLQTTRTVSIVFPVAVDPVSADLVDSLARPGGARPRRADDRARPRRRSDRI